MRASKVDENPARPRRRRPRGEAATADKLIAAAVQEFRAHGFSGTDSNKIAARAGFAPQTFYRWFADKLAIFLAVYRCWEAEEAAVVASLVQRRAGAMALAEAIVTHHRAYLRFRRSLRQLAVEHPEVRQARAQSRLRQIERTIALTNTGSKETLAPVLLQIERLADAIAEREFEDLGIAERPARVALAALLTSLRKPGG